MPRPRQACRSTRRAQDVVELETGLDRLERQIGRNADVKDLRQRLNRVRAVVVAQVARLHTNTDVAHVATVVR